jgi:citrate synthase
MSVLKERLYQKIEEHRPRTKKLMKDYCDVVIDEVTVGQAIGGMRGLKSLVTDISYLDSQEGIRYRGYTLPEVFEKLPKPIGAEMPYVEGLYFLLLTGDIPTDSEVADLVDEFRKRRILPRYVYEVIDAFPCCSHPMAIFSTAILTMNRESPRATRRLSDEGPWTSRTRLSNAACMESEAISSAGVGSPMPRTWE